VCLEEGRVHPSVLDAVDEVRQVLVDSVSQSHVRANVSIPLQAIPDSLSPRTTNFLEGELDGVTLVVISDSSERIEGDVSDLMVYRDQYFLSDGTCPAQHDAIWPTIITDPALVWGIVTQGDWRTVVDSYPIGTAAAPCG
jgi:hypothetical protein